MNEAIKERDITCLGVNSKGNGRYRLLFQCKDIDKVRMDDARLRTHFDRGTLYGEQWYPMRVDRVYYEVAVDEMGCSLFGQLNGVKVHKMRWLGNMSIDKEYRSMVAYLDTKEEVDRLLAKITVTMANGECAYSRPFVIGRLTCTVLSLPPLRPSALPLSSAGSNLWTVCTPRPFGINMHLERLLSAHLAVEKVPTRLLTQDVQYTDGRSRSYDHHHCIRTTNAIYSQPISVQHNPSAYRMWLPTFG